MKTEQVSIPLCHRCEHRAVFMETGGGPRCECQQRDSAVWSCYMYKPVMPLTLVRNSGDRRPQVAGYMLSSRQHAAVPRKAPQAVAHQVAVKGSRATGVFITWEPGRGEQ